MRTVVRDGKLFVEVSLREAISGIDASDNPYIETFIQIDRENEGLLELVRLQHELIVASNKYWASVANDVRTDDFERMMGLSIMVDEKLAELGIDLGDE